jgi:hypothetical protein
MRDSLGKAIATIVGEARSSGEIVQIGRIATRLAAELDEDPKIVARQLTNAGLLAHLNMAMSAPEGPKPDAN